MSRALCLMRFVTANRRPLARPDKRPTSLDPTDRGAKHQKRLARHPLITSISSLPSFYSRC